MARRDPLLVLERLRGLERDAARRGMAAAALALTAAERAAEAAEAALAAEASGVVADYAAWLPAAERARARAGAGVRRAEAGVTVARDALVAARASCEAVSSLLAEKRAAVRAARFAADQRMLDDLPG